VKKLIHICSILALLSVVFTGCTKMEELEPAGQEHLFEKSVTAGDDDVDFNPNPANSNRSGREKPIDGPDGVNDDDDSEDGDEVQSTAKSNA
jgi:hypothetical protein